jgi:hypothetical protein
MRRLLIVAGLTLAALGAGCASSGPDDEASARAACQEQGVVAEAMPACVERTMEDIRRARDSLRDNPRRTPPPPS